MENNKTLEDTAFETFFNSDDYWNNGSLDASRNLFKVGAEWQKEQMQPIVDSHKELLEALKMAEFFMTDNVSDYILEICKLNDAQEAFNLVKAAINKAEQLNK